MRGPVADRPRKNTQKTDTDGTTPMAVGCRRSAESPEEGGKVRAWLCMQITPRQSSVTAEILRGGSCGLSTDLCEEFGKGAELAAPIPIDPVHPRSWVALADPLLEKHHLRLGGLEELVPATKQGNI